jgi:flavin reductase (DIM6/NTAB) family NADH-FMN oxidoreductase RutF
MQNFSSIDPYSLDKNIFTQIGSDWMLITAGTSGAFNTMTASWGGMGVLWHKPVCFIFIRPNRYTYEFVEKNEAFTLSFFSKEYKKALTYCGTHSGRDVNKIAETGLTPLQNEKGSMYFEQAELVFECQKLYYQDIIANHFLNPAIEELYPEKQYHRMYIGEVLSCLQKQDI